MGISAAVERGRIIGVKTITRLKLAMALSNLPAE